MKVRILFFGSLAQSIGIRSCELELSDNAHVADALRALSDNHPELARHLPRLATAVNLEYVGPDHALRADDELALIPPVSGG